MNIGRIVLVLAFLVAIPTLVMACSPSAATAPTAATSGTSAKPAASTNSGGGGAANSDAGQAIFASNCNGCHPGGGAGVGPDIKGKSADVVKRQVRRGGGSMPPFPPEKISDQQLDALASYVSSLK